jgi:hypothetical protein
LQDLHAALGVIGLAQPPSARLEGIGCGVKLASESRARFASCCRNLCFKCRHTLSSGANLGLSIDYKPLQGVGGFSRDIGCGFAPLAYGGVKIRHSFVAGAGQCVILCRPDGSPQDHDGSGRRSERL